MDYHARHGHDVCSFDLPSTHRLPTVSAADALEDLNAETSAHVSTGLPDLDRAVAGNHLGQPDGLDEKGGIPKGQVTEVWGPPGVGKTTMGIQAAADVLRDGKSVVWVDCFHSVCRERVTDICTAAAAEEDASATANPLKKLVHFSCPSLAHFIALLCMPTQSSLPSDTDLVVVDSFSALVNHAFPRGPAPHAATNANNNKGPSSSSRRIQILQYIIGALQKLAATRGAAVVILTQCATRMQAEKGATLVPAINANVWEQGITTRVALYRDWVWNDGRASGARLAAVQKVSGKVTAGASDHVYAFEIEPRGLVPLDYDGLEPTGATAYTPAQKRKLDETCFEVPDSEDEDYGWQDDDDSALPRPPPQWQGSEDILLGQNPDAEDNDDGDDDDDDGDDQVDDSTNPGAEHVPGNN